MTERERTEASIRAILKMSGVLPEEEVKEEPKKPAKKQAKKTEKK